MGRSSKLSGGVPVGALNPSSSGAPAGEEPAAHLRPVLSATMSTSYSRRDYILRRILAAADATSILVAAALALGVPAGAMHLSDLPWVLLTLPAWTLIFRAYGLYERDVKRINHSGLDDVPAIFHSLVLGTLGMWVYFRFAPPLDKLALVQVVVFAATAFVITPGVRSGARKLAA